MAKDQPRAKQTGRTQVRIEADTRELVGMVRERIAVASDSVGLPAERLQTNDCLRIALRAALGIEQPAALTKALSTAPETSPGSGRKKASGRTASKARSKKTGGRK